MLLKFKSSEVARRKLTQAELKRIKSLYKGVQDRANEWSTQLEGKDNVTSILRRQYLNEMKKDLQKELDKVSEELNSGMRKTLSSVSTSVVADTNRTLNGLGLTIKGAYSFVPSDIVKTIVSGQLYSGDWTLSRAIWGYNKKNMSDINKIIAEGVASNKSSYEIAKALEKYVTPSAKKSWEWRKLYPGTAKTIDYNAQRLARTLISHAYQESLVRTTRNNPFVKGYKWLTGNHGRVCPLCIERAETVHADGLPEGVFPVNDLPLDHPNGFCTYEIYTEEDTDEMVNKLAAWVNGESDPEFNEAMEAYIKDMKG